MRIAVCIITYQRPEGLKRLLNGLEQQFFKKCSSPNLEIVIVDNDSTGSTYTWCNSIKTNLKWPLKCSIEPRRGIPYARNKAIESAGKDIDFIVFIDDDEVPEPFWLDELLYAQHLYKADVVSGPVLPYFNEEIPTWMIKGKFFDRPRYLTGHLLKFTATNNVLICLDVIKKMEKIFDERWALTGGSDKEFFTRVYRAGYKLVWADEALVYEWIPESRANVKWLLQRSYRLGNTDSLCELEFERSTVGRVMRILKVIGRMLLAGVFIPLSLVLGKHIFVKNLRSIYRSAGMLAATTGKRYEEYQVIHKV